MTVSLKKWLQKWCEKPVPWVQRFWMLWTGWCGQKCVVYLDTAIFFIVKMVFNILYNTLVNTQTFFINCFTEQHYTLRNLCRRPHCRLFLLESKCQCYITPVTFPHLWLVCFCPSCHHTPTLSNSLSRSLSYFSNPTPKEGLKCQMLQQGCIRFPCVNDPSARKH